MRGSLSHKRSLIGIYCKTHKSMDGTVFAACDKELIGKTLKDGKIEFRVSERFYKGENISSKKLREKLKSFDNINLVGERAVKIALEEKLVNEKSILYIQKIPHVQVFQV